MTKQEQKKRMALTDLESTEQMLIRGKIKFDKADGSFRMIIKTPPSSELFRMEGQEIVMIPAITLTVHGGYVGFYSQMIFHLETGEMLSIEAYE